jgi:hypothetical protein
VSRLRDHGLSLVFGGIFLLALVGESIAGLSLYNNDQRGRAATRLVLAVRDLLELRR